MTNITKTRMTQQYDFIYLTFRILQHTSSEVIVKLINLQPASNENVVSERLSRGREALSLLVCLFVCLFVCWLVGLFLFLFCVVYLSANYQSIVFIYGLVTSLLIYI